MSLIEERGWTPAPAPSSPGARPRRASEHRVTVRRWTRRAMLADVAAALLAAGAATLIRFGWPTVGDDGVYLLTSALIVVAWPLLLATSDAYDLRASLFGVEELRRILRATLLLVAAAGTAHIAFQLSLARGYFVALLPLLAVITAAGRVVAKSGFDNGRAGQGYRVIALGPAADIADLVADLGRSSGLVEVVGFVADDLSAADPAPALLQSLRRLPDRSSIADLASYGLQIDLLVRAGRPGPDEMWALSHRAHHLGIAVAVAPHRQDSAASLSTSYVPLATTPLLLLETPTLGRLAATTKAGFDRVVAATLLVALSPILLAIAAAIAVADGRPVFFRQQRTGRHGHPFGCWKFRTMVPGAEAERAGLLDRNEADGGLFKIKDDPRVTRVGAWLRRHSLDELPQLFNVVAGDMSLVGPRPLPLDALDVYDQRSVRRLLVKPGMTGLWQVEGRSDLPWDDGVYLDLLYVDQWSPLLDLTILARTVRTVLRPAGAY